MTRYRCTAALLPDGHVAPDVDIEVANGRIVAVRPHRAATPADAQPPASTLPPADEHLDGLVLPGAANVHSHSFHRALRGRTHDASGSFFTWRTRMYTVAAVLDERRLEALARACFAEMVLAGFTGAGEFHYLHHDRDATPYDEPNRLGHALVRAARDAGIRLTLLDTCYLTGGFGRPLEPHQRRFSDGTAARWAARVDALHGELAGCADVVVGAAVHSVRAVGPDELPVVARWAAEHDAPLHVHLSEQPAENHACQAATGRSPTRLLRDTGVLGAHTTAVHATHLEEDDIATLASTSTRVCLCPTTERDLGDGIGPAAALHAAGVPLHVGTDSHAIIDAFEEARAVELDARLAGGVRGVLPPHTLLSMLTDHTALGVEDAGQLAPGHRADLVCVDLGSVRTAGPGLTDAAPRVLFAAGAPDVTDVVVDGRRVVRDRRHVLGDVAGLVIEVLAELDAEVGA